MSALTKFQTKLQELMLLQTDWIAKINPFLASASNNSSILQNVLLVSGKNTINHKLGRKLQGWQITRQRAPASVYDNQDSNQMQDLTLVLISSASVVVDLEIF